MASEVTATPASVAVSKYTGHETILLVEDEDQLRQVAQTVLERNGYRVLTARNANEALALSEQHQGSIHLLLTDVVMPGENGRQLAVRLAAARPEAKTLFMSGYTDRVIVDQGILERGLHYMQKPFTPAVLARRVREVLDQE